MTVEGLLNILREYDRDTVVRIAIERQDGRLDMRGVSDTTSDWPYFTLYADDPSQH
jgi:hypothetical protein